MTVATDNLNGMHPVPVSNLHLMQIQRVGPEVLLFELLSAMTT